MVKLARTLVILVAVALLAMCVDKSINEPTEGSRSFNQQLVPNSSPEAPFAQTRPRRSDPHLDGWSSDTRPRTTIPNPPRSRK